MGKAPRRGPATRSGKRQLKGKRASHQGQTRNCGPEALEKRGTLETPEGLLRDETYFPCVEATVVPLALLEVLFAAAPGFVPLFFCATLFCGAAAFPCAIFFLLKSFTIL